MSKATQNMVSKKNPYWIPKNRYYELKYHCLQFGDWQRRRNQLDGIATRENRSPTESEAIERASLDTKIQTVMICVQNAAGDFPIDSYLLKGVTKGMSYDTMSAVSPIPVCRDAYYAIYRKFFRLLDMALP